MSEPTARNHEEARYGEDRPRQRRVYEAPAIIFTTTITTRAGSPLSVDGGPNGVDPMDLFGE